MKKVQFDLDYWFSHHPMLETRNGKRARLLATDMVGFFPVCYSVVESIDDEHGHLDIEVPYICNAHGYAMYEGKDDERDLFMVIHD